MNKKKLLPIVLLSLLVIGVATASLVSYFAKVTATISVEAPITLDQELFTFSEGTLNDGENHYLLIKGYNQLDFEVPAIPVITITRNGAEITDTTGIHLALDGGGDMHYCYEEMGVMTDIGNCDVGYVQYLTNNPDWFDWLGTDATYELSGFVSPVINHGGNSWIDGSSMFVNGVLTLPETGVDPGLIAALVVIRADFGTLPGTYVIKVEFKPVD